MNADSDCRLQHNKLPETCQLILVFIRTINPFNRELFHHQIFKPDLFQRPTEYIPKRQNLDSSKLKEFADDNFIFDENGRKFLKRVENTGIRRSCSLQAISLFPTVLSKDLYCRHDRYLYRVVS